MIRCRIGTDASGTVERGNAGRGIGIHSPRNTVVENLISGNELGILLTGVENTIRRNIIGPDLHERDFEPGGAMQQWAAILANLAERNVVRDNTLTGSYAGILLWGAWQNSFLGNSIGTDSTGSRRRATTVQTSRCASRATSTRSTSSSTRDCRRRPRSPGSPC